MGETMGEEGAAGRGVAIGDDDDNDAGGTERAREGEKRISRALKKTGDKINTSHGGGGKKREKKEREKTHTRIYVLTTYIILGQQIRVQRRYEKKEEIYIYIYFFGKMYYDIIYRRFHDLS